MTLRFPPPETPLTLAAQTEGSVEVIRTLCLGGAHIDFRARDGMTALHKAACARHCLALTVRLPGATHLHILLPSFPVAWFFIQPSSPFSAPSSTAPWCPAEPTAGTWAQVEPGTLSQLPLDPVQPSGHGFCGAVKTPKDGSFLSPGWQVHPVGLAEHVASKLAVHL